MKTRRKGVRRPSQAALAVVLGLASQAAMALGLGDIRVLSQPGQPLLAEIPVVSADPGELDAARVALASPATFARVGLAAPDALVSALRFDLTQDAQGRAVIRVSSDQPVSAPVVSFLVEVDWGRGRLVREYSALVDRPQTAQAVNLPQITAPKAAPSNTIAREPAPAAVTPVAAAESPAVSAAAAPSALPAPAPAPRAAAMASPAASSDTAVVVQRGQTLSQIAGQVARQQGASLDQAMVALLQANPHAFVGGSMHRLRAGVRLELPDAAALTAINQAQARALVREQRQQWAAASQSPSAATAAAPSKAATDAAAPAGEVASVTRGPRLEIAPAATGNDPARSIESGTVAGGQGDMQVSEQLRQAREDLATRDAEIAELRERVAELETLREQQQALIELKNNEMATAAAQVPERSQQDAAGGSAAWWWGGGLLLIGAALAAWLARRRKPSPLPPLAVAGATVLDDAPGASDLPAAPTSVDTASTADDFLAALEKADIAGQPSWTRSAVADDVAGEVLVEQAAVDLASDVVASTDVVAEADPEAVLEVVAEVAAEAGQETAVEAVSGTMQEELVEDAADAPGAETGNASFDVTDVLADASIQVEQPALPLEVTAVEGESIPGEASIIDQAAEELLDPVPLDVQDASDIVHDLMAVALETAPALADEPLESVPEATGPWGVDMDTAEPIQPTPGSRERLELAIAYLDLGDPDTARILLEEVAAAADQTTRSQALELLERLD